MINKCDNSRYNQGDRPYNYGIDLLRMLAMFMVVLLHILAQGGVLSKTVPFSAEYEAAWLIEIGAFCAVNSFALISGYIGIDSKFKFSNIIVLWLRVVFYTLAITAVFSIVKPSVVTGKTWIKALFPVMFSQYWYFTSYFAMFFFMPLLNQVLNNMEKKQLKTVLISICIVFSGLQTLFHRDVFSTAQGYTAWWLMILYLIGGYIKKYGLLEKWKMKTLLLGYVLMVTGTWISKYIIEIGTLKIVHKAKGGNYLIRYTSPTILLSGIFLLLIFKNMKIGDTAKKLIKVLSPLAFSVYLIHVHPLVWDNFMFERFVKYADLPWYLEVIAVLGTGLAIYIAGSAIDMVREKMFKVLKIKKHLVQIESKVMNH